MAITKLTKNHLQFIGWLFLSLLFLVSVIGKLYPTPASGIKILEQDYISPIGISANVGSYLSRFLLSIELFFVFAFVWPKINKKWIGIGAIVLLSAFCMYLAIKVYNGEKGNCGCFGQLIEMTPLQALIKNVLTIIGIFFLIKTNYSTYDETQFNKFTSLILLSIALIFIIVPKTLSVNTGTGQYGKSNVLVKIDSTENLRLQFGLDLNFNNQLETNEINESSEIVIPLNQVSDTSKNQVLTLQKKEGPKPVVSVFSSIRKDLDIGKKLVCVFNPECSHCIALHKKIGTLKSQKDFPEVIILFEDGYEQEVIEDFFKESGNRSQYIIINETTFSKFVAKEIFPNPPPGVFYLYNGNEWFTYKNKSGGGEININALKTAIQREK
jgi:hypothetical protein